MFLNSSSSEAPARSSRMHKKQEIKRKAGRSFMFDSLRGWTSGQLSTDELFHLQLFITLSGCISSLIAGTPTETLSEGSQRRFHPCCFRATGHRSTSKQKRGTRNASHSASEECCHEMRMNKSVMWCWLWVSLRKAHHMQLSLSE